MSVLEINLTVDQIVTILGFSIGFLYGETFSNIDFEIKYNSKAFEGWKKWLILRFLDANHHFQIGLFLMLVSQRWDFLYTIPLAQLFFLWMGWGLVISDWKDYKNILKRMGLIPNGETKIIETK